MSAHMTSPSPLKPLLGQPPVPMRLQWLTSSEQGVTAGCCGVSINLGSMAHLPAVVGFSLASSLLAIINKYALVVFPFPAVLTALQYLTSALAVLVLGRVRLLDHSPLTWDNIVKFFPAAFVFYMSLFTNMHLLQAANVDTFIVFRSCTPLLVAVADHLFRHQPWPSAATFTSLFTIFGGAVGYVLLDKEFTVHAYSWAAAYLFTITFDMVYIKHVVHSVRLNTWGLVLYNNLLALLIFPVFFLITGEYGATSAERVMDVEHWSLEVLGPVALSCAFGLAISFFAFACRKELSATAFTVVGVTNKFLTVIVNTTVWARHASAGGIVCLALTVVGSVMYQQSTVTSQQSAAKPKSSPAAKSTDALMQIKLKLSPPVKAMDLSTAGDEAAAALLGKHKDSLGAAELGHGVGVRKQVLVVNGVVRSVVQVPNVADTGDPFGDAPDEAHDPRDRSSSQVHRLKEGSLNGQDGHGLQGRSHSSPGQS